MKNKGLLFIISGPSGAGKGTVVKELVKLPENEVSISVTTRKPREGEIDGIHYMHSIVKITTELLLHRLKSGFQRARM